MRRPDLQRSGARTDLELLDEAAAPGATGLESCLQPHFTRTEWRPDAPDPTETHRRDGRHAVRLGLDSVRGIGLSVICPACCVWDGAGLGGELDAGRLAHRVDESVEVHDLVAALAAGGAVEGDKAAIGPVAERRRAHAQVRGGLANVHESLGF